MRTLALPNRVSRFFWASSRKCDAVKDMLVDPQGCRMLSDVVIIYS
jgi:hypothetical protein